MVPQSQRKVRCVLWIVQPLSKQARNSHIGLACYQDQAWPPLCMRGLSKWPFVNKAFQTTLSIPGAEGVRALGRAHEGHFPLTKLATQAQLARNHV